MSVLHIGYLLFICHAVLIGPFFTHAFEELVSLFLNVGTEERYRSQRDLNPVPSGSESLLSWRHSRCLVNLV